MQARDIMTTDVVSVRPDTTVGDVAKTLMDRHISAAPVLDEAGKIVGMISEGDLLRRPETGTLRHRSWWLRLLASPEEKAEEYVKTHGTRAADVMSRVVVTVPPDTPVERIAQLLEQHGIKRVPVVEDDTVQGVVSRADVIRALVSAGPVEVKPGTMDDRTLREQVLRAIREIDVATDTHVSVVVTDAVVHLWGFVYSQEEREAVRVACESVPGVASVDSHLGIFRFGTA